VKKREYKKNYLVKSKDIEKKDGSADTNKKDQLTEKNVNGRN